MFFFFQLLLPLCIHLASAHGRDMDHQSASICYQYRRLSKCFTSKRSASQSARHRLKPIVRNVMQNTHHHTHKHALHWVLFMSTYIKGCKDTESIMPWAAPWEQAAMRDPQAAASGLGTQSEHLLLVQLQLFSLFSVSSFINSQNRPEMKVCKCLIPP